MEDPNRSGKIGPHSGDRPAADNDTHSREAPSQGVERDLRGQEQPTDKSRAQQNDKSAPPSKGRKAQRDAVKDQPPSPGEPAGGE